MSKTKKLLKA